MKGWTMRDINNLKRRKPINKKSKSEHARAKATAWGWFSKFIRLRDSLATTKNPNICKCITCGVVRPSVAGSNCIQAGHWLSGRTGKNLFEENAVHGQCVQCNKWLSGNNTAYTKYMVDRYGQEECDRIVRQANTSYRYPVSELRDLSDFYRKEYNRLNTTKGLNNGNV